MCEGGIETGMSSHSRLVYLATAPDQIIAESWVELLRGDGIAALVRQDQPMVYLGAATNPCRIFVTDDRLEEARRLLADYLAPSADSP